MKAIYVAKKTALISILGVAGIASLLFLVSFAKNRICYSTKPFPSVNRFMTAVYTAEYSSDANSEISFSQNADGHTVISNGSREMTFYGLQWNSFFTPRFSGEYERVLPYALVKDRQGVRWAVFDKCANYLTSFK